MALMHKNDNTIRNIRTGAQESKLSKLMPVFKMTNHIAYRLKATVRNGKSIAVAASVLFYPNNVGPTDNAICIGHCNSSVRSVHSL